MGGQDGVVRFNHGRGHLGSRVDRELQLGFLAIIYGEALHKQGGEARASAYKGRIEDIGC